MSPPASTPEDLPAVTVVEITDPTAVNAGIELLHQEAVQLQSKPLRARRVIVRLDPATVREGLVAGSRGTTTVSAEALRWGFWHFGEFSRAYKECFGELPSDTLARSPGEARE
jgi:hypothetical protein